MAFLLGLVLRIVGLIGLAAIYQCAFIFASPEIYVLRGIGPIARIVILLVLTFLSFTFLIPRFSRRFVEGSPTMIKGSANSIFVVFGIVALFAALAFASDVESELFTTEHAIGLINIGVLVGFFSGILAGAQSATYKIRNGKAGKKSTSKADRNQVAGAQEQSLRELRQQRMQR